MSGSGTVIVAPDGTIAFRTLAYGFAAAQADIVATVEALLAL